MGIICGILFFGSFFLFLAPSFLGSGISILTVIALAVTMGLSIIANQQINLFNRSSMIEHSYEVTNKVLYGLPDSYSIFNNVCINDAQIDHVVVGSNGVFVVMDRSIRGVIHCDENTKTWEIEKTGRGGGSYTSQIGNPIKKLKWQMYTLSKYLKDNGCGVWVDGCVYFSNSDADLLNAPSNCFDSDGEVIEFIMDYAPKKRINPQLINKVKDLLDV